jgi:3'(2'), 5'-bisphosphate nucleotidase
MAVDAGCLDAAIAAAMAAGREIMAVYATDFASERKTDDSPLTEADRRAHAAIVSVLASTKLPVLSEEGQHAPAAARQAWERYWLVDPLDGTKEFIKRNGEFTVNIALMERQPGWEGRDGTARPVAGVMYAPVLDRLYFAWRGGGAYRQDDAATREASGAYQRTLSAVRLPVPNQRTAYTIVASRSHRSAETDAFIARMQQEHGAVALTSMGSALKFGLVAEGAADAYPRFAPTLEWDSAAGQAIVEEAGRQVIDQATGQSMRYNKNDLMNRWFIVR